MSILLSVEKAIFGTQKCEKSRFLEKEIKILNIDPSQIQTCLKAYWAVKHFHGFIEDTYFTVPAGKKQKKESLRIRSTSSSITVCYKEKKKSASLKKAYEREMSLPHSYMQKTHGILHALGNTPSWKKSKHRISYSLGKTKFDIDLYPWIPPILEIEGPSKKVIMKRIEKLGLENHPQRSYGTKKLFNEFGKQVEAMNATP